MLLLVLSGLLLFEGLPHLRHIVGLGVQIFRKALASMKTKPVADAAELYQVFVEYAHGTETATRDSGLIPTLMSVLGTSEENTDTH